MSVRATHPGPPLPERVGARPLHVVLAVQPPAPMAQPPSPVGTNTMADYARLVVPRYNELRAQHAKEKQTGRLTSPYDVLGILPSQARDKENVKRAYRSAMQVYHPDKWLGVEGATDDEKKDVAKKVTAITQELSSAYERLASERSRGADQSPEAKQKRSESYAAAAAQRRKYAEAADRFFERAFKDVPNVPHGKPDHWLPPAAFLHPEHTYETAGEWRRREAKEREEKESRLREDADLLKAVERINEMFRKERVERDRLAETPQQREAREARNHKALHGDPEAAKRPFLVPGLYMGGEGAEFDPFD
jgi:curved DNA-binding protein CbpA